MGTAGQDERSKCLRQSQVELLSLWHHQQRTGFLFCGQEKQSEHQAISYFAMAAYDAVTTGCLVSYLVSEKSIAELNCFDRHHGAWFSGNLVIGGEHSPSCLIPLAGDCVLALAQAEARGSLINLYVTAVTSTLETIKLAKLEGSDVQSM